MWTQKVDNLTASKWTEVELEIIKMTNVTRDIRIVIQNILDAKQLEKRIDEELLENFSSELKSILQNLRFFPTNKVKLTSFKVSQKITECREEDEHSEKTINILKDSHFNLQDSHLTRDDGRTSAQICDLFEANQQLIQQNQFLTKKLEQAEAYIKKIQYQHSLVMSEISNLKSQQKDSNKTTKKTQSIADRQSLYLQLTNENQQLRQEIQDTKQFIMRNNQDFVRQLQKYNEKIWKMERESQDLKNKLTLAQQKFEEGELLINKLREENFQLQLLVRNMKSLIGHQDRKDGSKDYIQGQNSDRLRPQTEKLKDFFRNRIQESFRRKEVD